MKQTFRRKYSTKYDECEGISFHTNLYTVEAYDILKTMQMLHAGFATSNLPVKFKLNNFPFKRIDSRIFGNNYIYWVFAEPNGEITVNLNINCKTTDEAKTEVLISLCELRAFVQRNITKSTTDKVVFEFMIVTDGSLAFNKNAKHVNYRTLPFSIADIDYICDAIKEGTRVGRPSNPIEETANVIALNEMNDICKKLSDFRENHSNISELQDLWPNAGFDEEKVVQFIMKKLPSVFDRMMCFISNYSSKFHEGELLIRLYFIRALLSTFFRYLL
jgi:hypothetical protein